MCLNTFTSRSLPRTAQASDDRLLDELVRLRRVHDRIGSDSARPLDVVALAAGARMSAGHLIGRFRDVYGESPYELVTRQRLDRAA